MLTAFQRRKRDQVWGWKFPLSPHACLCLQFSLLLCFSLPVPRSSHLSVFLLLALVLPVWGNFASGAELGPKINIKRQNRRSLSSPSSYGIQYPPPPPKSPSGSEETQEIFLYPALKGSSSPHCYWHRLFLFFLKTGKKSELGWGQVTHFSTKIQNCL